MPKKAENPLDPDAASYYLTIIGILRCMIEVGRIDILTKVLLSSSHVAFPRERHLKATVHVMHHDQKYNSRIVYDLSFPEIDHSSFKKSDWSQVYRDTKEAITMKPPEP